MYNLDCVDNLKPELEACKTELGSSLHYTRFLEEVQSHCILYATVELKFLKSVNSENVTGPCKLQLTCVMFWLRTS
jgi:hypothetical protein